MTTTHAGSQCFQRPELKLLDRTFRPAEFLCDIFNGFLFDESLNDYVALIFGKAVHKLKQRRPAFDVVPARLIEVFGKLRIDRLLFPAAPIGDGIRRNPEQPYSKGHAAPLEPRKVRQCVMEYFRSQVLRFMPVLYTANNERINALKVCLIQFSEAARILLSVFDQLPFLLHRLYKRGREGKSHGGTIKSLKLYSDARDRQQWKHRFVVE